MTPLETLREYCHLLRLPTAAAVLEESLALAQREAWTAETLLQQLLEQELAGRQQRRTARLLHAAHLPPGKTLATLDVSRLPLRTRRQLPELCSGQLVERADNLLLFGLPGTGKTQPC